MADTINVSTEDLRLVTGALRVATDAFGSRLVSVPGFGAALEAAGRLSSAADQAALPEDPVGGTKSLAIVYSEMLREFIDADFERSEAFRLVEIQAGMMAQLALARALHG